MTKINLLQKLAPTGIAALSVITATAGSMLFAPSAQAQGVSCFSGSIEALGALGSVQCLDKLFDNFAINPLDPPIPGVTAEIGQTAGGTFFFNVSQSPLGVPGPFNRTISYDITITDPNFFFDEVGFDTDVDQVVGNVQASKGVGIVTLTSLPNVDPEVVEGQVLNLVSINGDPAPNQSIYGATKISISDTIVAGVNSTVFAATNVYTQDNNIPEPSAMVGLVALGGLGLCLKRKKQS